MGGGAENGRLIEEIGRVIPGIGCPGHRRDSMEGVIEFAERPEFAYAIPRVECAHRNSLHRHHSPGNPSKEFRFDLIHSPKHN